MIEDDQITRINSMPSAKDAEADLENCVFPARIVPKWVWYTTHEHFMNRAFLMPLGGIGATAHLKFERKFLVVAERNTHAMHGVVDRVSHCQGWQPTLRTAIELADWAAFSAFFRWVRVFQCTEGYKPRLMYSPVTRLEEPEAFEHYNNDA